VKKRHVLLLSTLLLAGCGIGNPPAYTPYPPPSTTPATTSPAAGSESPVPTSPNEPFPTLSGKGGVSGETTVVGVVEEGVEHGCMILRTDGQMYQLVGSADPQIKPGARLSVRGRLNPGLVTTCQQGTPLQVVSVQPA
jgi:hypothetical protein